MLFTSNGGGILVAQDALPPQAQRLLLTHFFWVELLTAPLTAPPPLRLFALFALDGAL